MSSSLRSPDQAGTPHKSSHTSSGLARHLLAFCEVVYRIEGRPQHNLLDRHYCRLQESRAERKLTHEVLTDLTQRVSAWLATGEQDYEIGINTEPLFACQDGLRWAMAAHPRVGGPRRTFSLSSASRDRDWQRAEIIL